MSKHIGRLLNVGIDLEAVRGTAETTAAYYLPIKSFNHEDKKEVVFNDSALGSICEVKAEEIVQEWAEGGFDSFIGDKSIGYVLLALLGSVSSAVNETTAYDHTYTLQNDAQHDSLTIFLDGPNKDLRFPLAVINTFGIAFEVGKLLDFSAGFMSKKGGAGSNAASYVAENIFRPQDFEFKLADNVAGLTAASAIPIESFNINFEKNIEPDYVLGDTEPQDLLNKQFDISGDFTMIYDASTYEDFVLAGTNKAIRVEIENTDVTIGATTSPKLTFDLEPCALKEVTFERGLNDIVKHTISFRGMYNQTTSKIFDAFVLTNEATAYT